MYSMHQVIRTDVVDLADVRMIQRGDGASFLLKPRAMLALEPLDGDDAIQACVASLPDLAHAARANVRKNLIRAESVACVQRHGIQSSLSQGAKKSRLRNGAAKEMLFEIVRGRTTP